jgi:prephenate dehydrogenase
VTATVGVFGAGAIGGSIGLRARRNGARVIGADCDSAALELAREVGAVDRIASAEQLPKIVGVLVLAAHLQPTLDEIERLKRVGGSMPSLIIDVASVKAPVVHTARGLRNFVATHPMAGTERSGPGAARGDLFEGSTWAYVPTADNELDARAREFIEAMGAIPFEMSAEEHDRVVAITSHVPQIVAWCYAKILRAQGPGAEKLCGPVAKELLRISNMSSEMWRDILKANAENIEPELRMLVDELRAASDYLALGEVSS